MFSGSSDARSAGFLFTSKTRFSVIFKFIRRLQTMSNSIECFLLFSDTQLAIRLLLNNQIQIACNIKRPDSRVNSFPSIQALFISDLWKNCVLSASLINDTGLY